MNTNSVMFTALPTGIVSASASGTIVSLSVYVTPQLVASASLTSAPAFANWPSVVSGLSFAVTLGTAPTSPTAQCWLDPNPTYANDRFDSALWSAVFGPQGGAAASAVPVNTFAVRDYRASGVLSYGAQSVSATVKNAYKTVRALAAKPSIAAGGTDLLSTTTAQVASALNVPQGTAVANGGAVLLSAVTGNIRSGTSPATAFSRDALLGLQGAGTVPSGGPGEFTRVAAVHNRKNLRGLVPVAPAGSTSTVQLDFHQIIGHLADHPAMLRRLGLLIDLQFQVPAGVPDGGVNLSVQPTTPIAGLTVVHPITYGVLHAYGSASPVAFRPFYGDAEGPGRIASPLIDLNGIVCTDNLTILSADDLDVDHAAIHVANYAEQAQKDLASSVSAGAGTSLQVTLPALRTSGLAVHHSNREQAIGQRFSNNQQWLNGATFVAEDFLRGYRIDVRTVTTAQDGTLSYSDWKSQCARQATFTFDRSLALAPITITDEGYVKSSAMAAAVTPPTTDGSTPPAIYNVTESLFHWDGWSLVAARPGLSVGAQSASAPDAGAPDAGTPVPLDGPVLAASAGASQNLPFSTAIAPAPSSLTKLRFGTTYQFRIRAVDIAGNDMRLSASADVTSDHPSPAITFSRYEPISPPVLQLRKAVTEGESVEHLVIRSDPYASPPVYAADWAAKNTGPSAPNGTAPANVGMNPYSATSERHVAPPKTSVQMAEWHAAFDQALALAKTPDDRVKQSWAIATKEEGTFYDANATDSTTTQYQTFAQVGRSIVTPPAVLPQVNYQRAQQPPVPTFTGTDDIARGFALVPGQYVVFDNDTVMLPYLPDANAAGVSIQGLSATPSLRSFGPRLAGGSWPEMAPWRLVLAESRGGLTVTGLDPAPSTSTPVTVSLPPATKLALTYASTMVDPTKHAFCPPAVADQANAQAGLLPLLTPSRAITLVHAVQRPMAPGLVDGDIAPQDRNPGDTSQTVMATIRFDGASSGRVDLLSSWGEYVDSDSVADPTQPLPCLGTLDTHTPDVGESVVPNKIVRQMFGDTKRRDITYRTMATTRFREYFPTAITSDAKNITNQTSLPYTMTCKSSARPPVPKVLYAVPSFLFTPGGGATAGGAGTTTTSTRSGGIVRVYVDRGWWATGTGECLGVVLASKLGDVTGLAGLVSQWGPDRIWDSAPIGFNGSDTTHLLDKSHVNLATAAGIYPGIALAEGLGTVDIAAFAPNFNPARKLWYFDVGLTPDQAYFPFLRLALVRFQPQSVGTLHASPVVLTEFVQLPADRTASVANNGNGNYAVSVFGPSAPNLASPSATPASMASGHTVTAEFQQALTATPDAIDWTTIGSVTMLAPSSVTGTNVTYSGSLVFPSYAAVAGAHHRILVKEYEVYATDNQAGVMQGLGVVTIGGSSTEPYTQRLVYTDAIAIPS